MELPTVRLLVGALSFDDFLALMPVNVKSFTKNVKHTVGVSLGFILMS